MKHMLALMLLTLAALLTSCESCYNERFGAEMTGHPISEAVSLMGKPMSITDVAGERVYTWSVDQSYWKYEFVPVERDEPDPTRYPGYNGEREYIKRFSRISFIVRDGRIMRYSTDHQGEGMCNYFVPYDYLKRYMEEADKAAGKR